MHNMTLRYIFQVGGGFGFIKLFDKLFDAIEYATNRCKPTIAVGQEQVYNRASWDSGEKLSAVEAELHRKINTSFDRKFKNEKMLYRITTQPRSAIGFDNVARVHKIIETKTCEQFVKEHNFGGDVNIRWEAKIEVCLKYVELLDEVKVPGQPYQPAREEEGQTEWYQVHRMNHKDRYNGSYETISIDPTPRPLKPHGYNEPVEMEPSEFWYLLSGNRVQLTTTED